MGSTSPHTQPAGTEHLFVRTDGPTEPLSTGSSGAPGAPGTDADPIFLLHGGPGASHDYIYPQMLFLARKHRLITYDQRGGGRSRTDDPTPITWQTHVQDLAAMVAGYGNGRPTIIGYSWGGLLALLYTLHAHEFAAPLPKRVVLISPAPITRAWRADFEKALSERSQSPAIRAMREELQSSGIREHDVDAYRKRAFELSVAGYFADPTKASQLTPFRVIGRVQQSTWESLGDYDLRDSIRDFGVPSLVVHGRHDPIPMASSEAVAQRLGARLVVLEHSGHVPYVEQPAELSAAIEKFLEETAG